MVYAPVEICCSGAFITSSKNEKVFSVKPRRIMLPALNKPTLQFYSPRSYKLSI